MFLAGVAAWDDRSRAQAKSSRDTHKLLKDNAAVPSQPETLPRVVQRDRATFIRFSDVSRTVRRDGTVRLGNRLYEVDLSLRALEVECLPKDLPEEIVLDISELALDRALHVRDLSLPDGVRSVIGVSSIQETRADQGD